MTHRLSHRVSKLESNTPDYWAERYRNMPFDNLSRLCFLRVKNNFEGLPDDEKVEIAELDGIPLEQVPEGPFQVDDDKQKEVNKMAKDDPEYRQYASRPVWLEDRNHIIGAVGHLLGAAEKLSLSDALVEIVAPLIKRIHISSYQWAYERPFTYKEIDQLADALSGQDLGLEGPWFREYLKAHADLNEYYKSYPSRIVGSRLEKMLHPAGL